MRCSHTFDHLVGNHPKTRLMSTNEMEIRVGFYIEPLKFSFSDNGQVTKPKYNTILFVQSKFKFNYSNLSLISKQEVIVVRKKSLRQ